MMPFLLVTFTTKITEIFVQQVTGHVPEAIGFISFLISMIISCSDFSTALPSCHEPINKHITNNCPFHRFVVTQILQWGAEIFPGIYNHTYVVFQENSIKFVDLCKNMLRNGIYSIEGLQQFQSNFDTPDFDFSLFMVCIFPFTSCFSLHATKLLLVNGRSQ
jgi:hypothetical protein